MNSIFDDYRRDLDSLRFDDAAKARMAHRLAAAARADAAGEPAAESKSDGTGTAEAYPAPQILELPIANRAADATPATSGAPVETKPGAETARPVRRPRQRHVLLRAAAAIAIALGVSLGGVAAYGAATMRSPAAVFSDIFGGAPAKTEVLNIIGHPIGASATSGGVTVTADAVAGDARSYTVVFSIEKTDGTPFNLDALRATDTENETNAGRANSSPKLLLTWGEMTIGADGESGKGGGAYFYDADPSDNAIQYVVQWDNVETFDGGGVIGRTCRVHLRDLISVAKGYDKPQTIAKGTWDLKFQMGYETTDENIPAGQAFSHDGLSGTVEELTVSPVGVHVKLAYDQTPKSGQNVDDAGTVYEGVGEEEATRYFETPIIVSFADGHVQDASVSGGSIDSKTGEVVRGCAFDRIENVDDIVSVTVGDTVIPVK